MDDYYVYYFDLCYIVSIHIILLYNNMIQSILFEAKDELLNVTQQNKIFLFFSLFPSVIAMTSCGKQRRNFSRFLQWLRWIEEIAVQKKNDTNIGRHVMEQIMFAFVLQFVHQNQSVGGESTAADYKMTSVNCMLLNNPQR